MKKMLSVILSISILVVLVMNVSAVVPPENAVPIEQVKSQSALVSVKAVDVNKNVLNVLTENGADIDSETIIEVLNIDSSDDTAICVTNVENGIVAKDVYIAYAEEENDLVVDNTMAEVITRAVDHTESASFPPLSWDGSYIVHATATMSAYTSNNLLTYYKPYRCSFYYENFTGVTVNSISVEFISQGYLYTYPGYQSTGVEYRHLVTASKTSPAAGVTYTGTNYFASDRVLWVGTGSVESGMYLTFLNYINGSLDTYTVKL